MLKRRMDERYRDYEDRLACYAAAICLGVMLIICGGTFYVLHKMAKRPLPQISMNNLRGAAKYQALQEVQP